jgi:hypothetical protein
MKYDPADFEKIFDVLNKISVEKDLNTKIYEIDLDLYYYFTSKGKRTNEYNKINDVEGC